MEAASVHSAARRCYGHELDAVRGMPPRDISIAVVGGGIGGLTAAISLLQAGFDVQVYEQARWLSEVGAGINIGPNASRLLIRLGLDPELAKVAFRSPFFHQRRWQDGRTLTRTPLGQAIEAEFGAPHYIFHRGELHAALAKAVPPERVHLAHRCVEIRQHDDRVEARFENDVVTTADVLVGRRHTLDYSPRLAWTRAPAIRVPRLSWPNSR